LRVASARRLFGVRIFESDGNGCNMEVDKRSMGSV
jgi:hypothetical protein